MHTNAIQVPGRAIPVRIAAAFALIATALSGLVAIAVGPSVGATEVGYNCSAPAGWQPLHDPANSIDIQVRDQLEASLASGPLPITLTYTGPSTGYQGQQINAAWSLNVHIELSDASDNVNLRINPGPGTTNFTATNATPSPTTAPIPDMALQERLIGPGITAAFDFTTTLNRQMTLGAGDAVYTPGAFTLPLWVAAKPFAENYGVSGTMECTPVAAAPVGSTSVNLKNGGFTSFAPKRILNTATSSCVSGSAGRNLTVAGVNGVPAVAEAVAITVTASRATSGGYVTVSPAGGTRPKASNVNYLAGQTISNKVIAKVGTSGQINLFAYAGCPHLTVDITGWYEGGPAATGGLEGLTPVRLLDTRTTGGCISATGGRNLTVTGVGGVPLGAGSVVMNVTVTKPTASGYLTVSPTGSTRPKASNLNYVAKQTVPNLVIAKVGTGGRVNLYAYKGCPHVLVDVVGWFDSAAAAHGGFSGMTPVRLLDSRKAGPCLSGSAGRNLKVAGVSGVPSNAAAVVINVTALGATSGGTINVTPTGTTRVTATSLAYAKGTVIPTLVIAKVGTSGNVNLYASGGCPNVLVDVAGWFVAP